MPNSLQRRRGLSFRGHYHDAAAETLPEPPAPFRRSPTLTALAGEHLIPPKDPAAAGRLSVVLDLDETLVYARDGPLYVRPGVSELFEFLAQHCETIVWTRGEHRYADAVLSQIDHAGAVAYTIYRHGLWGRQTAAKELRLLGRDLDSTVIIENTPDSIAGQEQNAILVEDYGGGELEDTTLSALLDVLREMVRRHAQGTTVPEFVRTSPALAYRAVLGDSGATTRCYCLAQRQAAEAPPRRRPVRCPFNKPLPQRKAPATAHRHRRTQAPPSKVLSH